MARERPLEVPGFRRLLASYGLNELGWGLGTVALAVLVYARTHSALATTGLFMASSFVPAVLAPAITVAVERLPRARSLAGISACEALVFGGLALVAADAALVVLFVLAMLDGTLALAGRALTRASVAGTLSAGDQLRRGNALLNVVWCVGSIAGPALGGGVVALAGPSASLGGAALVFLGMASLLVGAPALPRAPDDGEGWSRRLRSGLAYVARRRAIRRLALAQLALLTACTLAVPVEVVYAQASLHAGAGAYGLLLTAWGAGMVGGSLVFARARRCPLRMLNVGSLVVVALAYTTLAGAPSLAIAALGCVAGGVGNGISAVAMLQVLQQEVEGAMQARVMSLWEGMGSAGIGVGYALGGGIAALSSPRVVFAVAAAGTIAVALVLSRALPREPVRPRGRGERMLVT